MIRVIVNVTPECEGLLHSLPRHEGWYLLDEDYAENGNGAVTIQSDDLDDLSAATEQALNTNSEVISYQEV